MNMVYAQCVLAWLSGVSFAMGIWRSPQYLWSALFYALAAYCVPWLW